MDNKLIKKLQEQDLFAAPSGDELSKRKEDRLVPVLAKAKELGIEVARNVDQFDPAYRKAIRVQVYAVDYGEGTVARYWKAVDAQKVADLINNLSDAGLSQYSNEWRASVVPIVIAFGYDDIMEGNIYYTKDEYGFESGHYDTDAY